MTDNRPSSAPPRPARRPTQESPLVWGLVVAVMFLAFVNFLFVAIAAPSPYRVGLAVAAGAFLVLSVVLFVRSSRQRRRVRGAAPDVPDSTSDAARRADGRTGRAAPRDADGRRSGTDTDPGSAGNGPGV
jgi:membrane protein implicated in regulation of membrane protease activity